MTLDSIGICHRIPPPPSATSAATAAKSALVLTMVLVAAATTTASAFPRWSAVAEAAAVHTAFFRLLEWVDRKLSRRPDSFHCWLLAVCRPPLLLPPAPWWPPPLLLPPLLLPPPGLLTLQVLFLSSDRCWFCGAIFSSRLSAILA